MKERATLVLFVKSRLLRTALKIVGVGNAEVGRETEAQRAGGLPKVTLVLVAQLGETPDLFPPPTRTHTVSEPNFRSDSCASPFPVGILLPGCMHLICFSPTLRAALPCAPCQEGSLLSMSRSGPTASNAAATATSTSTSPGASTKRRCGAVSPGKPRP